jgi:lipopolysaccharide export system protein LptA
MTPPLRAFLPVAVVVALLGGTTPESIAEQTAAKAVATGPNTPNAFQGFSRQRKEPVKIEADALEVHDKENYAIFNGNVVVQQGESTMRSRQLKVFYEGAILPAKDSKGKQAKDVAQQASAPAAASKGGAAKNSPEQKIRRLEALGGVIVSSKDQKATGDVGIFDMPKNTATISGNVVITQGQNVMRGDKLVVDLTSGVARLEAGDKGSTRVQGLFVPNAANDDEKRKTRQPSPAVK